MDLSKAVKVPLILTAVDVPRRTLAAGLFRRVGT